MKGLSFLFFLLLLGNLLYAQQTSLSCTIKTNNAIISRGETPEIIVEIKNNSDKPVMLIRPLDGSEVAWRYPYSKFKIERLGDTSYQVEKWGRCGNMDGISAKDFFELKPGESYNPYEDRSVIYQDFRIRNKKNFEKPGVYRITYLYSTKNDDFKKWIGDMEWSWFDYKTNQVKPEHKKEYDDLLALFGEVPRVELHSNELIIEVK